MTVSTRRMPGVNARGGTSRFRRSVAFLAESGVRQFFDIGTGLLTANNTHEVAHAIAPESRVVCVDNDSLVLVHERALLVCTTEDATAYVEGDRRDPAASSTPPVATLDLDQPVAVTLMGILHHVADTPKPRRTSAS
ncbi:SAM-dependent methyltransferase [Actinopolymorpha sp. B11F2]|uniref:SAM-dependent methyltransferase n=1 Tax=Actinopolymorpha sp. B11F2 TaxID=3160862 RepID=UPI0032E4110D